MLELAPLSIIRVVDTETTGFPPNAEMVEIGWTDLVKYPEGWVITGDHQSAFVNPGIPIPAKATEIHGITDQMVAYGMPPVGARKLLAHGAAVLVAHNARFDRQFVRSSLPWICTMECARTVWPGAPNHKNETLKEYLGITVKGDAHRAGYDAAVSANILLHLMKHLSIDEMISLSDPGRVPLTIPFGKHKGKRFADLPDSYLQWIVGEKDMRKGMKTAARLELDKRAANRPTPVSRRQPTDAWNSDF